ncbi:carbohydrate-binding module family 18 protein [Piromyces sp. E2]|nr:carbohydrate-binding module family 18 protein [Piromyces sp. E2]|eukprot:OUM63133.1 carbohydrate-binding module family 18 protein [Piromyces sp. E2]
MKIISIISLLLCTVSFLEVNAAADYEITHYGCYDKDCLPLNKEQKREHRCDKKCDSMSNPSCYKNEKEAFGDGRNQYFSAISTHIASDYKIYCKDYAIVMLLIGKRKPLIVKTRIVDSCSSCPQYHLDLGQRTFERLLPLKDGIANVIWGIYSEDGTEKKLIYNKSNSKSKKTAEAFGVSLSELAEAFSASASALARSSDDETQLSIGGGSSKPSTSKTKTSTTKSKTSTKTSKTSTTKSKTSTKTSKTSKTTKTSKTSTKKSSTKKSLPTSYDKCGKDVAVCADGYCCSKYGYCGKTDDYCKSGCQSEYGTCKSGSSQKISKDGRCGPEYGRCPDNLCCSEYGWCDRTSDHCGSGCQSDYGECY